MRVLVTGAFGNIGVLCIEKLIAEGHQVRCSDIDGPHQRRLAKRFAESCDVRLGDIRDSQQLPHLLKEVDAIIHLASILPPNTETMPDLAYAVNVEATQNLIDVATRQPAPPLFIFSSSLTVFGASQRNNPLRHSDDCVEASDNYTHYKLLIEDYLQRSTLPWIIMRIGVAVDGRTTRTERRVLKQLLSTHPDTPLEYIHPRDVALAMVQTLQVPEARGKVLLIGGGQSCQITLMQFMNAAFAALGLEQDSSIYGTGNYYTHWLDTSESQQLLQFQQTRFDEYQRELKEKFSALRFLTTPVRPLLKPLLPMLLKRI